VITIHQAQPNESSKNEGDYYQTQYYNDT